MSDTPTFAACLTPPGTAAIATIAVRGPEALALVERLFQQRPGSLARRASEGVPEHSLARRANEGKFTLGKFGTDTADDVVLIIKRCKPVPWVELHCHGGREVVRLLLDTLQQHGVTTCSWTHLERLTIDQPLRAEAQIALAHATTVRTAAILLDQVHGAFERALERIAAEPATALTQLDELAGWVPLGLHLTQPWRVVLAGAPNVGKSSLVNALAGFQRSIVSPTPGTTRDVVAVPLAIDGWPVELSDTAGLRSEAENLEEQGIALARAAAAQADLCLWVLDGSAALSGPVPGLAENTLVVINKVDLPAAWAWQAVPAAIRVCAQTGAGLADLCAAIARQLVPEGPPPGTAVPFTPFLCEQIRHARQLGNIEHVQQLVQTLLKGSPNPT